MLISKLISAGILIASVIIKAPVIHSIISSSSVDGISFASLMGECVMFSNATFYGLRQGYDFTAYGEAAIQVR